MELGERIFYDRELRNSCRGVVESLRQSISIVARKYRDTENIGPTKVREYIEFRNNLREFEREFRDFYDRIYRSKKPVRDDKARVYIRDAQELLREFVSQNLAVSISEEMIEVIKFCQYTRDILDEYMLNFNIEGDNAQKIRFESEITSGI